MNEIIKSFEGSDIRIINQEGAFWFVASDVCRVLEVQNVTQAVQRLDDDERSMFNIGRQGFTNMVNEYGLYSLILTSRKPEAKQFKRWVTHDVLPAIRETGSYKKQMTPRELRDELLLQTSQDIEAVQDDLNNFRQEFRDQNRLLPSEVDDLYNMVVGRSKSLAKQTVPHDDNEYSKQVGVIRRKIWGKLKKRYAVSKYIHLPRKDFDDAMTYLQRMTFMDLI